MIDSNDSVRQFFRNRIFETIPAIRKKNKRPDSKVIFSYIARNSATNVDESFIDKMLNELLAGKVIVNNPTHVAIRFYIGELFSIKRKRFTGTYYKTNRYYNTTEAEKLFSTDENKGNTKQKQKEHRDTGLNSYETLIVEIIELKGFVMEELYNVNKHFTDLSS